MKVVQEISVKLQNRPGTLSEVSEILSADGIGIVAMTVTTEGDLGTLRFVATDPKRVVNILESAGYAPSLSEIIAVETPSHPGGLNTVLRILKLAGVNVEHVYSCVGPTGVGRGTVILIGVDNPTAANEALSREWIRLYGDELYTF